MSEAVVQDCTPEPPDAEDFRGFYLRWHPALLEFARGRYGHDQAEEIAQETLSRAFSHFGRLRQDLPWPWLRTVAHSVACDQMRYLAHYPLCGDGRLKEKHTVAPSAEDVVMRRHDQIALGRALMEAPDPDRELLRLAASDGMTSAALADHLQTTTAAVRVRLHRARRRLFESFEAKGGQLAVAPMLLSVKLRQWLRPWTGVAAETTSAIVAVAAAVATTGTFWLGGTASPPAGGSTLPAMLGTVTSIADRQHARPVAAVTAVRRSARPLAAAAADGSARSGGAPQRPPVGVSVQLGSNPSKPGTVDHEHADADTPTGPASVDTRGSRSQGPGLLCLVTGLECQPNP